MENLISFFNSNFFIAFITLVVGGTAFFVYWRQKKDRKKDAASILLMEIRSAERAIDTIMSQLNSGVLSIEKKILPTNNWIKHNYLFIEDLDRDELDLVNNFYNQCTVIDKALQQLNISTQLEQKSNHIHKKLVDLAEGSQNKKSFNTKKKRFLNIIEPEKYVFKPGTPLNVVVSSLQKINKITTSTAGEKLKKVAKQ